jgi:hypothetical protein
MVFIYVCILLLIAVPFLTNEIQVRHMVLVDFRPPMPKSPVGSQDYEQTRREWLHDFRRGPTMPRRSLNPIPLKFSIIVAGSGGHTMEMISMLSESPDLGPNNFRRWVVTEGDNNSIRAIYRFEDWMQTAGRNLKDGQRRPPRLGARTYDIVVIRRARKVHQPMSTVPFTALLSIIDFVKVFSLGCPLPLAKQGFPFPHVILTNGPGTGFIIALTAYTMRIFFLIPEDLCRVVFVESIARVNSLSLTGRLFHKTNIADRFIVQHPQIAEQYGVHCEDMISARQPDFADF